MEKRDARVMFNKAGGNAGKNSYTTKISLPVTWVREMGITQDERGIEITFHNNQITIKKK